MRFSTPVWRAGGEYEYIGIEIKSKEEREQEEREYLHRIFPGGTAQKAAVEQQLKERLPRKIKRQLCFTIFWRRMP